MKAGQHYYSSTSKIKTRAFGARTGVYFAQLSFKFLKNTQSLLGNFHKTGQKLCIIHCTHSHLTNVYAYRLFWIVFDCARLCNMNGPLFAGVYIIESLLIPPPAFSAPQRSASRRVFISMIFSLIEL